MKTTIGLTLATFAVASMFCATASATLPMMKQYAANYPDSKPKCLTCHVDKKELNEYGVALKKALNGAKVITPEMFKACEAKRPKA
jgi:hypothetical protein